MMELFDRSMVLRLNSLRRLGTVEKPWLERLSESTLLKSPMACTLLQVSLLQTATWTSSESIMSFEFLLDIFF